MGQYYHRCFYPALAAAAEANSSAASARSPQRRIMNFFTVVVRPLIAQGKLTESFVLDLSMRGHGEDGGMVGDGPSSPARGIGTQNSVNTAEDSDHRECFGDVQIVELNPLHATT